MWQLSGLPCFHAVACINTVRADVVDYCDSYFSIERWKQCYSGVIHPIPSMNMWPPFAADLELQPPKSYALPERPKKSKKKDVDEAKKKPIRQSATKRCGNFKSFRHNKTTCTKQRATSGAITSVGIGRGRPRGGGGGSGSSTQYVRKVFLS